MLTNHFSGFAVVFAEDVPDVPQQDFVDCTLTRLPSYSKRLTLKNVDITAQWEQLCPTYNSFLNSSGGHT
jgi:hypothetical protein